MTMIMMVNVAVIKRIKIINGRDGVDDDNDDNDDNRWYTGLPFLLLLLRYASLPSSSIILPPSPNSEKSGVRCMSTKSKPIT